MILSLSLGIFLGEIVFHHIPEWLVFSKNNNPVTSAIFFGFGIVTLMGFEFILEIVSGKNSEAVSFPLTILLANFLHSLVDGILVSYSFLLGIDIGWMVCVSILVHELPKSISFISLFLYSGFSKRKAVLMVFISGLGVLWGLMIGQVLNYFQLDLAENVFPLTTGILLFLALGKIYPELKAKTGGEKLIPSLLFFILGLGMVYSIRNLLLGGH